MSRERQRRQSEAVRSKILEIARRIVCEEGAEALSIRRITKEMDYSSGIVYHYFASKEQLLACLLQGAYNRILNAIKPADENLSPGEAIRASFKGYIENALRQPEEYRAFMFGSSPQILEFTSVLGEDACEKRPAIMMLVKAIEAGIEKGAFAPCDPRITAQTLWSAVFGLVARLIIEGNIPGEQRAKLIDRQIDIILKGMST